MGKYFICGLIFAVVVFFAETVKHLTFNQIYYGNMLGFSNFLDVLVTTVLGYAFGVLMAILLNINKLIK
ncbi:hypothetical protein NQ016_03060 [Staphylococcus hyicus]|uniref:hypothetical protein n=1 Tax=Staphylococcus hyicus TaxID=1284 RepID=UPI00211C8BAD|nr:hypothetical protein [Staphylococcus hyicus]MCQ9290494.1 hypothetical protein [Staphylococcus hyicus]MCQ9301062.1 hypothetical protein [Staphylococcus hyicus]MCQ9305736.1 hypothetical protein [Staphylococcus hyicus]MCQ9308148.1 hypothetical protein [Staphylococcus hyicus]MCQ9310570.1 hypothetical protein [Staphylococcus hyicus]